MAEVVSQKKFGAVVGMLIGEIVEIKMSLWKIRNPDPYMGQESDAHNRYMDDLKKRLGEILIDVE